MQLPSAGAIGGHPLPKLQPAGPIADLVVELKQKPDL